MSVGLLPPMVLELRAVGSQLFAELAKTDAAIEKTGVVGETTSTKMQAAFDKTAAAGKGLALGLGAAGVAVAAVSVKMAADFQSKMTLLQTAAGESKQNIGKVSDGILNLAGATGTSIEQLSEGMYTVEKSGNRGAAGLNILKAAAEGAKAENVDLSIATNALTSVMMSYHLGADKAVQTQNMLIAGSGMAKTTMQEYAGSLSTVIPVASAAGVQFDQVAGAIATLTQHGTSANEATQELANTIRNLQAPSQVAQKAMQQIGLNVNDVSTNLGSRGLTGTIDLITNAISSKMGPGGLVFVDAMKKSQSASADMQTMLQKMPAALADASKKFMDGSMSMKDYQKAVKDMGGSSYSMGAQFLSLSKATQGFNQLLTSGQPGAATFSKYLKDIMGGATGMNTALMLGGENMAYFKSATEEVNKAGEKNGKDISTWAQTQKNLNVQLAQAGEGISAMGVRLGTVLIPFVSQAIKTGEQWAGWLQKNPPMLIAIASVLGGVMAIAILAYVAKLGMAAVANVQLAIAEGRKVAAWVAGRVAALASAAATAAQTAATYTASAATSLFTGAQNALKAAQFLLRGETLAYIGALAVQKAQLVAATVATTAQNVATKAMAAAQFVMSGALAETVAAWIASKAQMVASIAVMVAMKGAQIAAAVATGVMTAAQWAFNVAADANPIGLIILAIAGLIAIIILVITHWKEVTSFLNDAWKNVGSFFKTIGDAIAKWWNDFWNGIVNFAIGLFKWYVGIYIGIFTFLWNGFVAIGTAITNWWNGLWNGITSFLSTLWNAEVKGWTDAFNWLYNTLVGIGKSITEWWNGLWKGIADFVSTVWKGAADGIIGFLNGVIDMVNRLIGGINTILDGIKTASGGTINLHLGNIPHLPSFDVGTAAVPGRQGAPLLAVVHGGEPILSNDMMAGRAPIPQRVTDAVNRQQGGGGHTVIVQAQTNATPRAIASLASWELRRMG